jgi:hypothetical protein
LSSFNPFKVIRLKDRNSDLWITCPEPRDQLRQNGGAYQAGIGNPQVTAVFTGGFAPFLRLGRALKGVANRRHEGMSRSGQRDMVIRSLNEKGINEKGTGQMLQEKGKVRVALNELKRF